MVKKTSHVSVIIPTHNRAALLRRSVESVLNQSYQNFELIIVDDASTDNTQEIIRSFNDPRISYIRNNKNRGGAAARNIGIEAAKGSYIAFQDSDDEWLPEKLEKQINLFKTAAPHVGVVYTGFYRVKDGIKTYIPCSIIRKKEGNISKTILNGSFVSTQTVLAKRECFDKAGLFDEELPRLQDWELFIRISRFFHFNIIDEPLVLVHNQAVSISSDNNALIKALKHILQRHFDIFHKNKNALSKLYVNLAMLYYSYGDSQRGKSCFIKAVEAYPLNVSALAGMTIGYSALSEILRIYKKTKDYLCRKYGPSNLA